MWARRHGLRTFNHATTICYIMASFPLCNINGDGDGNGDGRVIHGGSSSGQGRDSVGGG